LAASRGTPPRPPRLEVEDIEDALLELKQKGMNLIDQQPRVGHANSRIAFIDPKSF
jgi:methylmalonyl-CoA/ethylmalonyl-CoA epimerase